MRLKTDYAVGKIPLSEYPRPQMRRESYVCLNGVWGFQKTKRGGQGCDEWQDILVPFSPETLLSGVEEGFTLEKDEQLIYRRSFTVDDAFVKDVTLLHFGAVDQSCQVYLNGMHVGGHEGGFTPFTIDITAAVKVGENELIVVCVDETEGSSFCRGKQSSHAEGIWYTAQSGIWQTVWLESVVNGYIAKLRITPNAVDKSVCIATDYQGEQTLTVYDGERVLCTKSFTGGEITVQEDFTLWSPENPKLYDFTLETDSGDRIASYFGVRSFSVETDSRGKKRLCLNGKPYFMNGMLDQGYWCDGLLTPPSYQAMYDELKRVKDMGFNMLRKHIKIEPLLWYAYCDRLGILVWQDFVNGGGEYNWKHIALFPFLGVKHRDDDYAYFAREDERGRTEFWNTAKETMETLYNCPCISTWVPFNEGWGQFDSGKIGEQVRQIDDTRWIDTVSGWHDQGATKTAMKSLHIYYTPLKVPNEKRPVVLSEYGGYSHKVAGHVYDENVSFGYKTFSDRERLVAAIKTLFLKKVKPLIAKGLCAAVYTQVTDVETEINGLITYDRKIVKVPVETMKAINDELMDEAAKIQ